MFFHEHPDDCEFFSVDRSGTLISKVCPGRAVRECLAGLVCYLGDVIGNRVEARRIGITDSAGAVQWLRGEQPHTLIGVEGDDPNNFTTQGIGRQQALPGDTSPVGRQSGPPAAD